MLGAMRIAGTQQRAHSVVQRHVQAATKIAHSDQPDLSFVVIAFTILRVG